MPDRITLNRPLRDDRSTPEPAEYGYVRHETLMPQEAEALPRMWARDPQGCTESADGQLSSPRAGED